MRDLSSKILLLLYCLFSLLFVPLSGGYVAGLFVVISCSCLLYVFPDPRIGYGIIGSYLLCSLLFPTLSLFYPILFYDLTRQKNRVLMAVALVLLLAADALHHPKLCLFLLLGMVLSSYLAWQNRTWQQLEHDFIHTKDDSRERTLILSEKNRHLIERQNQELYTATLKERNRIAREIHDNVGHMLSRSILMLGALKAINQQEAIEEPLTQLQDTLDQAMSSVRESVHDLHDDSVDLKATIKELTKGFQKCPVQLEYDMGNYVPNDVKYSFINIVKEALANIIKHSDATQVTVRMREHPGLYQLLIEDNGSSSADSPQDRLYQSAKNGMGLQNIQDRVRALGGNIQIQTVGGFHIFITVPKQISEPGEGGDPSAERS